MTLDLAAWRTYELGNLRARRDYATRIAAEEPADAWAATADAAPAPTAGCA